MIRFIHAADVHLDSPLRGLEKYEGAPVEEIRGATRRALENLVGLAVDREVDFVLISGDLYDGDWKDHNTGLFFVRQMARLREADIPAILISGNHDAANKMTKSLCLPDNVELLGHNRPTTATCKQLANIGVAVHGQSFGRAAEYDNLVRNYPPPRPGMLNIGLLHTSLDGAEGHEPYAPCSLDDLRQKQYDYWALGHVHTRRVVHEDPLIVFPGNLQGRHVRESGAKGCYLVTVDERHQCDLEFVPLDVFRWAVCEVDATDADRPEDIVDQFAAELARLGDENDSRSIGVRVEIVGRTEAHQRLLADPIRWTNEIRAAAIHSPRGNVWIEQVKWRTSPPSYLGAASLSGPIETLTSYLAELRNDHAELRTLAHVLQKLQNKLPDELRRGDDALRMDDAQQIADWLGEVEPLLLNQLTEGVER